ncbi:MAG: M24 family metallopeptidase, partial [Planctomycetaceae bacterium]
VEATARNCTAGQSESEIAGELAHRLIRREIMPERLQVWADGQSQRYPHAAFSRDQSVERFCTIAAVARRWGLCAAATRTVCFGEAPQDLQAAHHHCGLIQATGVRFSQPEWELFEVWNRVRRIYEKFGHADEWRRAEQAEVIGYRACEVPLLPKSEFRLASGMAMHWHPSVGPAVMGDTFLINADSREVLTPMEDWPRMRIEIKDALIERPEILQR